MTCSQVFGDLVLQSFSFSKFNCTLSPPSAKNLELSPVQWGVFTIAKVVLLSSILALPALAQSLTFQGAPPSVRLGGRTLGVRVQRLNAAGFPVTAGNTMVVVTAPPGGQISLGPQPFSAWSTTLTVGILPGSALSPQLYLRSGLRGLATWSASAPGFAPATATVLVRDDALTCDLESGTRLDTELPPGCFNVLVAPYMQSSMTISASAAHRGSFGVRLVDGESSPGNAADTALFDDTAPLFGDVSARTWVRVMASNGQPAPIIAQFTNATGQSPSLIDIKLRANLDLAMGGFGADAGYSELVADAGLRLDTWHLLEFAVTGTGSSDGGRSLWLDGRLLLEQRPVDFSGALMSTQRLAVGEPYADDRRWMGTIDFDDVRSAGVPLASRLQVQAADGGFAGECLSLEVQLRASMGRLTAAGELVPIDLNAGGGAVVFIDPSCAVPGQQVVMQPNASIATLSFRASQPNFFIVATSPDFLSTRQPVTVVTPTPVNIVPSASRVRAAGVLAFTVTGGTGRGLSFRMAANPSGGVVDPTGRYQAGGTTGVMDRVEVQDSAGQTAVAIVEVFPDNPDAGERDGGGPDAGEPDAGERDAGEPDAGERDAGGPDAGDRDAGDADAGDADAGFVEPPRALGVGCGCAQSGAPVWGMLFFALSAWRRGRVRSRST